MKTTKKMVKEFWIGRGWIEDKWGNIKMADGTRRIKLGKTSWRYEFRAGGRWVRISGGYYSRTTIDKGNNSIKIIKGGK